jgi:hypothetical protein
MSMSRKSAITGAALLVVVGVSAAVTRMAESAGPQAEQLSTEM